MTLPAWANFHPHETRAACRSPHSPFHDRLTLLANMPGLTQAQKAKLTHRGFRWIAQFKTTPATPTDLTLQQAIALYHAVGWNGLSGPFLSDQVKARLSPNQIQQVWGLKSLTEASKLIHLASKGTATWWQ